MRFLSFFSVLMRFIMGTSVRRVLCCVGNDFLLHFRFGDEHVVRSLSVVFNEFFSSLLCFAQLRIVLFVLLLLDVMSPRIVVIGVSFVILFPLVVDWLSNCVNSFDWFGANHYRVMCVPNPYFVYFPLRVTFRCLISYLGWSFVEFSFASFYCIVPFFFFGLRLREISSYWCYGLW